MHKRKILSSTLISLLMISVLATFVRISKVTAQSGLLTGNVFDKGIDEDHNELFDFLQIKVEVNIATAGTYYISASSLTNGTGDLYNVTVNVYDSLSVYLNAGIQNVSLSFYGPTIQASGFSGLAYIANVYISGQIYSDSRQDIPLSRGYSYSEFDAAFSGVEATFRVFPNGTVDMTGMLNATHLVYPQKDLNLSETADISTTGDLTTVSVSGKEYAPWWVASQEPFKSALADMQATYSKNVGTLNLGLNATAVLPQDLGQYSGYPMNSSDFTLNLAYSTGKLNGELDAATTLPPTVASVFPFNATDFSLEADYRGGLLKGNVTFHLIPGLPLGDLTLDFSATRTQVNAAGNITVIYGTYGSPLFSPPVSVDEAFVDSLIANVTALEGTGPDTLYNMTNGIIEFDTTSSIIKTPVIGGSTVDFNIILDGDPIALIAFIYSKPTSSQYDSSNITYPGVYHLLNTTLSSFNSGSVQLSYAHASQTATAKITFIDDLQKLLQNLFTLPADSTPFVVASSDMMPTLLAGDIVLVQNVTDASQINAAPYTGDIIAFNNPQVSPGVVVHRAVNRTNIGGTWYFQTQGDSNYSPDYWSGSETFDGMISESLLIGKVVERIPMIGYVFLTSQSQFGLMPTLTLIRDFPEMLKDLLAALETFNMQLDYTSGTRTFNLELDLVFDALGYWNIISPKLPDIVAPSMKTLVAELLANMYAQIDSADISFTYAAGQAQHQATVVVKGDFIQEVNYIKSLYLDEALKSSPPSMQTQLSIINSTWVDVSNLEATFSIADYTELMSISGIRVAPPIDAIDENSFRLYRFFNLTAPSSPSTENPRNGEQLKLTVEGGNNGTHTVTVNRPLTVPVPDYVSDDHTVMVWNNQSISSLKDLIFSLQSYTGIVYNGQTYPVITQSNGTVSTVTFAQAQKQLTLSIDGPTGETGFANVSIPKNLIDAPTNGWIIIIGGTPIYYPDYQITETATTTFLYFTFTFGSPVTIQIIGTEAVSEFPTSFLLILIIGTLVAATAGSAIWKTRRKRF